MKYFYLIICFSIIFGCKQIATNSFKGNKPCVESTNFELRMYEVLSPKDEVFVKLVESLPEIEDFRSYGQFDIQNIPLNFLGVTSSEDSKQGIIDQLQTSLDSSLNLIPMWSKNSSNDMVAGEEHFRLFLLKDNEHMFSVKCPDLVSFQFGVSPYSNRPALNLLFGAKATKGLALITERASERDKDFLAIVVQDDVYLCPTVEKPLTGGAISIPFTSIEGADEFAKLIR